MLKLENFPTLFFFLVQFSSFNNVSLARLRCKPQHWKPALYSLISNTISACICVCVFNNNFISFSTVSGNGLNKNTHKYVYWDYKVDYFILNFQLMNIQMLLNQRHFKEHKQMVLLTFNSKTFKGCLSRWT